MKTDQNAVNLSLAPSQFRSAMHAKCPKCRTGNMFANAMYSLKGQQMHKDCPHCGFHFETEPGYFYVAMFVSYAMNVALLVACAVATYVLTGSENPLLYVFTLLVPAFVMSPVTFRYSRVILLYWLTPNLHFDARRMAGNHYHPVE